MFFPPASAEQRLRPLSSMLLFKIGTYMDAFGKVGRLAYWVGNCQYNNELAGKRKSGHVCKSNLNPQI